jgi:hypothetical protein
MKSNNGCEEWLKLCPIGHSFSTPSIHFERSAFIEVLSSRIYFHYSESIEVSTAREKETYEKIFSIAAIEASLSQ